MDKYSGNQVVNSTDMMKAMCEYIATQINGRFRLQFPQHDRTLDNMVEVLHNPLYHSDASIAYRLLTNAVFEYGKTLTDCMICGCKNDDNHEFYREFINLVWDSRDLTEEWLRSQGIVPGQSAN